MGSATTARVAMILIVPVLNRYDLLVRMINSIDYEIKHLLVIDNGGYRLDEQVPFWEAIWENDFILRDTVLHMPTNLGVAASWNLGIKCFPFEQYWTITSVDTEFMPGALEVLDSASRSDALTLTAYFPHYQAFSVGEQLVQKVGLFDESIYPIYFEDNDYERRVTHAGFDIVRVKARTQHDNSSTIHSDEHFMSRNSSTFASNQRYFQSKEKNGDYSEGRWNLQRVRDNNWRK